MKKKRIAAFILSLIIFIMAFIAVATMALSSSTKAQGPSYTKEDADMISRCVWGEYRGYDMDQIAGVVWCILNRVDDDRFPNDIQEVITAPNQFFGYSKNNPLEPRIQHVVYDVLARWQAEGSCIGSIGRILPREYVFFHGNGRVNCFKITETSQEFWDWSLPSPYEEPETESKK